MKKLALLALTLSALNAYAAPPYTFSAGGSIRASEINANFTYLDNLISSKNYVRASRTTFGDSFTQSLFTVPAGGTQHLITFLQYPACSNSATLTVGSDSIQLKTTGGEITGLNIPVNAGETVSFVCTASSSANRTTFISLSK